MEFNLDSMLNSPELYIAGFYLSFFLVYTIVFYTARCFSSDTRNETEENGNESETESEVETENEDETRLISNLQTSKLKLYDRLEKAQANEDRLLEIVKKSADVLCVILDDFHLDSDQEKPILEVLRLLTEFYHGNNLKETIEFLCRAEEYLKVRIREAENEPVAARTRSKVKKAE